MKNFTQTTLSEIEEEVYSTSELLLELKAKTGIQLKIQFDSFIITALQKYRKYNDVSYEVMSSRMNVSARTLNRLVNDTYPFKLKRSTVIKIVEFLPDDYKCRELKTAC